MRYNGPNPNKQVGGELRRLVTQLMRRSKRNILVIVWSDMWWEHGGKHLPEDDLYGAEVCRLKKNRKVDRDVKSDVE